MSERTNGSSKADDNLFAAALAVSIIGGLILAFSFVATVPAGLAAAGGLLFVFGLVLAFVLGYRASRADDEGLARALQRGLGTLWDWLRAFVP